MGVGGGASGELHTLGKKTLHKTLCGSQEEFDALVKGKAIPLQAWTGPEGSSRLRPTDFKTFGTPRW